MSRCRLKTPAGLQAHQGRRDEFRLQVKGLHLVGRDVDARNGGARLPVQVDGRHGVQADVQRAVHRRARGRQDAAYLERLVGVLDAGGIARAVRERQAISQPVAQPAGHLGAQHHVEDLLEGLALGQLQAFACPVAEMLEIGGIGSQHRKAAVRIPQRDGNRPGHQPVAAHSLVGVPADLVGGVAQPEHRIQHQLQRARACPHDQVST